MSAKFMSRIALLFLMLTAIIVFLGGISDRSFDGVFFLLIMTTIFYVASSIKKDIEDLKTKLDKDANK